MGSFGAVVEGVGSETVSFFCSTGGVATGAGVETETGVGVEVLGSALDLSMALPSSAGLGSRTFWGCSGVLAASCGFGSAGSSCVASGAASDLLPLRCSTLSTLEGSSRATSSRPLSSSLHVLASRTWHRRACYHRRRFAPRGSLWGRWSPRCARRTSFASPPSRPPLLPQARARALDLAHWPSTRHPAAYSASR